MPIEWWPRGPYDGESWRIPELAEQNPVDLPYLDDAGGGDVAIVVPTRPRGTGPAFSVRRRAMGLSIGVSPLIVSWVLVVFGVMAPFALLTATTAKQRADAPVVAAFGVVIGALGLVGLLRLLPVENRVARGTTLTVGPGGITVDRLRVPWSVVEEVVTFRCRLTPADDLNDNPPYSWLAVRVSDFDAVLGLTPFRAGLANLTRRRLVLLAEASEVARPWELRDGLECLVEDPSLRPLLATEEGVRLLLEGEP